MPTAFYWTLGKATSTSTTKKKLLTNTKYLANKEFVECRKTYSTNPATSPGFPPTVCKVCRRRSQSGSATPLHLHSTATSASGSLDCHRRHLHANSPLCSPHRPPVVHHRPLRQPLSRLRSALVDFTVPATTPDPFYISKEGSSQLHQPRNPNPSNGGRLRARPHSATVAG